MNSNNHTQTLRIQVKSKLSLYSLHSTPKLVTSSFGVLCSEYNDSFHLTCSLWGPFPHHCVRITQLILKKCRSSGKPLATLCPIWPTRDFNLKTLAPETNAIPLEFKSNHINTTLLFTPLQVTSNTSWGSMTTWQEEKHPCSSSMILQRSWYFWIKSSEQIGSSSVGDSHLIFKNVKINRYEMLQL